MSDKMLRFLIAAAISMLLIYQVGSLIAGIFGMAWGAASSVVVAGVSFLSARLARAGGKSSLWFLLPTLIFTVVPILMSVWNAATGSANWYERLSSLVPFMLSFGAPVVILLLVYYELRKRAIKGGSGGMPGA